MRIQFAIVVAVICALLALVAADPDDTTAMIVRFRPGFSLKSQIGRALVRDVRRGAHLQWIGWNHRLQSASLPATDRSHNDRIVQTLQVVL